MPTLNPGRFLSDALDSVFSQTASNWELIVCEGGSTDGSLELLNHAAANDHRITIIQDQRQGLYAALNQAIRHACGEYIYLLMADDTMQPNCLEVMAKILDAELECGLSQSALEVIDEEGVIKSGWWETIPAMQVLGSFSSTRHVRSVGHDALLQLGCGSVNVSLTQLLIRRKLFFDNGWFRTDFGSEADFEWYLRVVLRNKIAYTPAYLSSWRIHPGQLTRCIPNVTTLKNKVSMIKVAFESAGVSLPPLDLFPAWKDWVMATLMDGQSKAERYATLFKLLLAEPLLTLKFIWHHFIQPFDAISWTKARLNTKAHSLFISLSS
jgi:glycosyltransferase involved in cell wall biosynthesis